MNLLNLEYASTLQNLSELAVGCSRWVQKFVCHGWPSLFQKNALLSLHFVEVHKALDPWITHSQLKIVKLYFHVEKERNIILSGVCTFGIQEQMFNGEIYEWTKGESRTGERGVCRSREICEEAWLNDCYSLSLTNDIIGRLTMTLGVAMTLWGSL